MDFLETIRKLAETVDKALDSPAVPAIIEIGRDVVNLIDSAKDVVAEDNVEVLTAIRDELEPKVMAHADRTEHTLRGSE